MKKATFHYQIGDSIKDDKRDLVVIDLILVSKHRKGRSGNIVKRTERYVRCHCNKCAYEFDTIERNIEVLNTGCPCCSNKVAVLGINTIWDTDGWMCDLGVSEEDAKKCTHSARSKVDIVCPYCGKHQLKPAYQVYDNKTISCSCQNTLNYPEKFVRCLLDQVGVDYIYQFTKTHMDWCDKYRYDFYFELNNEKYIIEVNGMQHYEERNGSWGKYATLKEQQDIDKFKMELALSNGIKEDNYIVIDFRYSKLDYGKENVLNSKLNQLFDLSNIDWIKCDDYSFNDEMKDICDKYEEQKNNKDFKMKNFIDSNKRSSYFIYDCLKRGSKLGYCNFKK